MREDLPFTSATRRLLADALGESNRLGHVYVGTEHVVLALTRQPDDIAILDRLGIDGEQVRGILETIITPGQASTVPGVKLPYTSRTNQSFEYAAESARTFRHGRVTVEHVVLGLMREQMNIGAQVLQQCGLTAEKALEEVQRLDYGISPP